MVFRHAPIPRKGSGKQQQQQQLMEALLIERFKPSLNVNSFMHMEQGRFCTCFIERYSAETLLIESLVFSVLIS